MSDNFPHPLNVMPENTNICSPLLLSNETIVRILRQLDLQSLLRCKMVCKKFKSLVETQEEIQYIMELEIAGMVNNENCDWPYAQRLESLRKFQSAWDHLELSGTWTFPQTSDSYLWEMTGDILAQTDSEGAIHFLNLPLASCHVGEATQTLIKPDITIQDFTLDASQDLLVWVTQPTVESPYLDIHMRSLHTGSNHPLARQPTIRHHFNYFDTGKFVPLIRWDPFSMEICQDYIGLKVIRKPEDNEGGTITDLMIWNWKEGKPELVIHTNLTQSFAFASEQHIVLANLYVSNDFETHEVYLTLIDFKAEDAAPKPLEGVRHSLKLRYPRISHNATVVSFDIYSNPSPGWVPTQTSTKPFHLGPEHRLFVIPIHFIRDHEFSLVHFVPLSAFRRSFKYIGQSNTQWLSWSDWAPAETRLVPTSIPMTRVFNRCSFGSRYIGKELLRRDDEVFVAVLLYDFNQLALQRKGTGPLPEGYIYVDKPSALRKNTLFEDRIETSLPFGRYAKKLPIRARADIMCAAEVIIEVEADDFRIHSL